MQPDTFLKGKKVAVHNGRLIIPRFIRLESSTRCQLKCPSCPTASGETTLYLGRGCLSLGDFKEIIEKNPFVCSVELSNWGEMFWNRELAEIIEYAHKNKIDLHATNGVNLNDADTGVLEALVKYKFRNMSCSIDGASQETYSLYRKNGHFDKVIANIKTINHFKKLYRSPYPQLRWKFVAFGHNEHEIVKARQMARDLNMFFCVKLSWEDLYTPEVFSPVRNAGLVGKESGLLVADRTEFREKYGYEYALRDCCLELWHRPQINFDGRLLGCSINYWSDFGNVFREGLIETVNNEKIAYARRMLMGQEEARDDIPCVRCKCYQKMKQRNDWIAEEEVEKFYTRKTPLMIFKHAMFRNTVANRGYRFLRSVKRRLRPLLDGMDGFLSGITDQRFRNKGRLRSTAHSLEIPFAPEAQKRWTPRPVFKGSTKMLEHLSCHVSALAKDHCPHPPHNHDDEELLLVLFGEVDLILPELISDQKMLRLKTGQFVYYPNDFPHTIQTASEQPANYMMFKWRNPAIRDNSVLKFGRFNVFDDGRSSDEQGFQTRIKFDGSTAFLKRLQCHVSTLGPGSGYAAHCDPYDVAIVVFSGEVETLGRRVGTNGVIFYAAGRPHGMSNPGETTAWYIVFEFHGK